MRSLRSVLAGTPPVRWWSCWCGVRYTYSPAEFRENAAIRRTAVGGQYGNGLDGYQKAMGQNDIRGGRASRWRVGHVAGVDLVEYGEVVDIGIEDGCLHDVGEGRPGGLENGREVG